MARLFTLHSKGLAATYADIENQAMAQGAAFLRTAGSLLERSNGGGFRYYALQQYDQAGTKKEVYLAGPIGDPAAERAAEEMRIRIREQRDVIDSVRLLIREGYGALGPKHYVVIAALGNAGVFSEGGALVGTHAFEVILNRLGIRASAFPTTDVDVARASKIAIRNLPEGGFLEILRSSGLDFQDVPNLDPRDPPIKFKEKGHSRFIVDLLVPSPDMEYKTEYVPELKAHATALPYFKYLISETQPGAAISRAGCVAVRVPVPEKFAVHKLLVSQLRVGKGEKSRKDIHQAAILIAALCELHPGAIEEAFGKTPVSSRSKIRKSLAEAAKLLADHPAALEEIERIG
jgi:hypothetical protein